VHHLDTLLTTEAIRDRVAELGATIASDYEGRHPCIVALLNGALIFTADLVRHLPLSTTIEFIKVASYEGTESTGEPRCLYFPETSLAGRDVLIVDDILDTGHTLSHIKGLLLARNPESVRTCVFLDKPSRRVTDFEADYVGFEIEDAFVVGYGMDYNEQYRNLPYVAIIRT